jgi:transcriptional regulator with XRE-family HTH domain
MKNQDKKRLAKFRKKLAQLRVAKGLSQRALSNKCKVGHGKISKLENVEDTNLNLTTLFELAKGLGVHPRDLIDYEVSWVKD